jgi:hypothetical protein
MMVFHGGAAARYVPILFLQSQSIVWMIMAPTPAPFSFSAGDDDEIENEVGTNANRVSFRSAAQWMQSLRVTGGGSLDVISARPTPSPGLHDANLC